jgi:hypothetical protein
MFLRLWGLVGIYEWGKTSLHKPPKDAILKTILFSQIMANTVFQICENVAYLNKLGLVNVGKRLEGQLWLWSTRCWAMHIFLDFVRLERESSLRAKKSRGVKLLEKMVKVDDEEAKVKEIWMKALISNAANMPLSVCPSCPVSSGNGLLILYGDNRFIGAQKRDL